MPAKDAPWQPNLYVVARFLDALARPDETLTRSQLQAAAGVNYDVFRRYLEFLEAKRYVTIGETVRLTAEGRAVRAELLSWIGRFLGAPSADTAPPQTLKEERPPPARE